MKIIFITLLTMALVACAPLPQTSANGGGASGQTWDKGAIAATANPYATDAAIAMLEQGGHAVDAAIAAHLVLGLVEPQSSGIGGGGFMLVYERVGKAFTFHDGREQAPAGATPDMFMRDGKAMDFIQAWQSGLAVGVPGTVALYKSAHDEHGRLPWPVLFEPAISLASEGFVVSPRLAGYLPVMKQRSRLDENPGAAEYFYPDGKALQAGDLRINTAYAETLRRIAGEGLPAFYSGTIAQGIALAARAEPNPGTLSVEDLSSYQARRRPVNCGPFRDVKICTTSPPSSGGAQIMIAGLYDNLTDADATQSGKLVAFVDAQRLAYADRDHYFGDPDEVDIPLQDLLNPVYLQHRATQRFAPQQPPTPGDPAEVLEKRAALHRGHDTTEEANGTTHLSIIDNEGNAVAFTATVEAPFGSQRWVAGFLLNNEMTDFAREVPASGALPANAIGPGRRPRSSMSPTMVLDGDDNLLMVTGSPGGNSIPAYVSKSILGVFDWQLSAQQAVDHPNIIARGEKIRVETGVGDGLDIARQLKEKGYDVTEREGENSGIHLIVVRPDGLEGAADSRREGTVRRLQQPGSEG